MQIKGTMKKNACRWLSLFMQRRGPYWRTVCRLLASRDDTQFNKYISTEVHIQIIYINTRSIYQPDFWNLIEINCNYCQKFFVERIYDVFNGNFE